MVAVAVVWAVVKVAVAISNQAVVNNRVAVKVVISRNTGAANKVVVSLSRNLPNQHQPMILMTIFRFSIHILSDLTLK
jgi:hypothetical protein